MESSINKKIGNNGEERASIFLENAGYKVLERNYRSRYGEIDIIVCKNETVVFVEVKTWPRSDFFSLAQAVDYRKQKRIIKTAKCFLAEHRQYKECYVRFDLIALDISGHDKIFHIENAFSEIL
ncbi:MAG: YraN family protein [Treponema sp.]|jgi:putative endonuclease|nr:YraN family protein [Treponema sp.]